MSGLSSPLTSPMTGVAMPCAPYFLFGTSSLMRQQLHTRRAVEDHELADLGRDVVGARRDHDDLRDRVALDVGDNRGDHDLIGGPRPLELHVDLVEGRLDLAGQPSGLRQALAQHRLAVVVGRAVVGG